MERSSKQAFRDVLTAQELKGMQTISAALPAGVLLFLLVVVMVSLRQPAPAPGATPDLDTARLLSLVHAALALGAYSLTPVLYRMRFAQGAEDAEGALATIRGALILRLAMLEAPALFGVIVCLLSAKTGALAAQPLFWLNGITALIFLVFAATGFPTRDRVEAIHEARF